MLVKNQEIQLNIVDQGISGEGIGKYNGFPVFVKDAIVGDKIKCGITKVKKNLAYGRIIKIEKASKKRVEPKCEIAKQCGGCQIQALSYDVQLRFKTDKVANNLKRIGGFNVSVGNRDDSDNQKDLVVIQDCIGMEEPWHYRNKAQVPFGYDKNGNLVAGFYVGRTHQIIPMEECAISFEESSKIINAVKNYMINNNVSAYKEETGEGIVRHVLIRKGFFTEQILVCLIINSKNIPNEEELVDILCDIGVTSISLNFNKEKTNVILGDITKIIYGKEYIEDYIGEVKFRISAESFFQVNPIQTEKLYTKALEFANIRGNETVWDLYCGAGTISLFLARKAKQVYGVEIVPEAIRNAKENAKNNNIENVGFFCGKAEEIAQKFLEDEKYKPDVVVVDPPRKGCDKNCLDAILTMKPKRVVYVSCDSATLARDLKYLSENGMYKLEKVQPVDMFPHTVHVETVVLMSRGEE